MRARQVIGCQFGGHVAPKPGYEAVSDPLMPQGGHAGCDDGMLMIVGLFHDPESS
jgi:hypothetical protein